MAFTLIACVAVGGRSLQGSAKSTLQARWFLGAERVEIRARLRVVTNVFIGLGTVLAGVALLVDTAAAYRTTMVVVGLFTAGRDGAAGGPAPACRGFAAGMDVHLDPDRVPGPLAAARPHLPRQRGAQLGDRDAVQHDQRRRTAVDRRPGPRRRPW